MKKISDIEKDIDLNGFSKIGDIIIYKGGLDLIKQSYKNRYYMFTHYISKTLDELLESGKIDKEEFIVDMDINEEEYEKLINGSGKIDILLLLMLEDVLNIKIFDRKFKKMVNKEYFN